MKNRTYLVIDLKSFYASVECLERGLDPMETHLVVADASRTEKTICLAVSPALRALGVPGRPRLFEVIQKVKEINAGRARLAPGGRLEGASWDDPQLKRSPGLALDFITALPRMALYMKKSTEIYQVYLKYIAPEDMHVYSIDEVFMDVTGYLDIYGLTARQLAGKIIRDVLETTGITAAAGIGTNLYLCKAAMDIEAKHIPPDEYGVRIACLDEISYRKSLWTHRPLTDFWRVGKGYAEKLEAHGLYTMGDIARCSLGREDEYYNEELLYRLFGVNAELLIDHAWGVEPCTIADIRAYRPKDSSVGSGQVLPEPYPQDKARLIVHEMAEGLALSLLDKGLVTEQLVLTLGYDRENLTDPRRREAYKGEVASDRYGRAVPRHAHGTIHLDRRTSSARELVRGALELFDRIADPALLVRRVYLTAERVREEAAVRQEGTYEQLSLFGDGGMLEEDGPDRQQEKERQERERKMQEAMLSIKKKYGKNAILKGVNLEEGATGKDRNNQIGGHRA